MSNPVDVAGEAYEAFAKGDLEGLGALLAPDTLWRIADVGPLDGEYRGTENVFGFLGALMEATGGTFSIEVVELFGSDTRATAILRERGKRHGRTLDASAVHVMRVEGGRIAEFWAMTADPANFEFWAS